MSKLMPKLLKLTCVLVLVTAASDYQKYLSPATRLIIFS